MLTENLFRIAQGGAEFILWFLLLVSVISLAMILERWWVLRQLERKSENIQLRLREALHANNLKDLEDLSRNRDSLESRALGLGLRYVRSHGINGLSEIFNSFALMERPQLEGSLNWLATIGSNAPFVGLLGTVLGIMKAFQDLSLNGAASAAAATNSAAGHAAASALSGNQAVMLGIAEALVSTAVGLLVAIPAVIAYNYFQRKVRLFLQNLELVKDLCLAYALSHAEQLHSKIKES